MERRLWPRVSARLPLLFVHESAKRAGTLVGLSRNGAHVEVADERRPPVGGAVRLILAVPDAVPIELGARVVRHSAEGFAVQLVGQTPVALLELLADLGAGPAKPPS